MKGWIVEEDSRVVHTTFYAVEAETRDDAIEQVVAGKVCSFSEKTYPDTNSFKYTDTHEAASSEWPEK